MLTVYVRNVSKCADISDYEYAVMVNAKLIARGEIRDHRRADGWRPLIKRIAEQEDNDVKEFDVTNG